MLKPFMRLFGIDDDGEPDSLPPKQRGLDACSAQPGPEVAQAGIMLGERDEPSEPDRPAGARR